MPVTTAFFMAPDTFPCGCRYTQKTPSRRRAKSPDYVRTKDGAAVCKCGTKWRIQWSSLGDYQKNLTR